MTDLTPIFEQVREFAVRYIPLEFQERTVAIAAMFLVGGVGLSVLGAKLAKPAMTTVLGLLGALGGVVFARNAGVHEAIGGLVGALMFATVSHLTFRLWVGVASALVLSTLALGAFSYQEVLPHYMEFVSPAEGRQSFTLPSPEQQAASIQPEFKQWASDFWAFASQRDERLPINSQLVGFGAAALGLFLGVIAVRWMLILATSIVGTGLVTTAVATTVAHYSPGSEQTFLNNAGVMGMGVGAFLVSSLILQTLLTRKAPESGQEKKNKS
ncbi:MAG: hypothetical protein IIB57_02345 [Planctomycetes bacterium]|nr:hypothetical protein [Planctomycetota bacterium]